MRKIKLRSELNDGRKVAGAIVMCNRPTNRDQRKGSTLGTQLRGNMD